MIPFGEWLPDQAALGAAQTIKNVVPFMEDYGPLRSLSAFSNALDAVCVGAVSMTEDSTVYNFAGDATKLYSLTGATYANVSKSGNYTGVSNWEFERFGNRVIATSLATAPQYFDMGTSTLFADLPGSPPIAARVGVVRGFLVLGEVENLPSRLVWSGSQSTENWVPSRASQSDIRDLRGQGGRIQRILSGQYGVIFQENSIWVMTYQGPPTIFNLQEVERGHGTPSGNSVCRIGNRIFYLSHDGFYTFGESSEPIGSEKVDRWFFNEADAISLSSVRGVVDRVNKLVLWAFKSDGGLAYNDRLIIFNWATGRWTYGEVNTEVLLDNSTAGYNLDTIDTLLTNGIDIDSFSVDSTAYVGGRLQLTAFDSSHRAATFEGAALEACLETKEIGESAHRTMVRRVRPLVDGAGTMTVRPGTRNSIDQNVSYGAIVSPNSIGEATMRSKARYHRFQVNINNGFEHAIGVDVSKARVAGRK